jgi:hypothetical protein
MFLRILELETVGEKKLLTRDILVFLRTLECCVSRDERAVRDGDANCADQSRVGGEQKPGRANSLIFLRILEC